MSLLDYFRRTRRSSASIAKDRLQIIVARQRSRTTGRDYLPNLHQEIVQVIAKYEEIDPEQVKINLDWSGEFEVLELNIVLPEKPNTKRKPSPPRVRPSSLASHV